MHTSYSYINSVAMGFHFSSTTFFDYYRYLYNIASSKIFHGLASTPRRPNNNNNNNNTDSCDIHYYSLLFVD